MTEDASRIALLCIPHLAGNASTFELWRPHLLGVDIRPAELPGRYRRAREAPATSIAAIVEDLASRHRDVWTRPFAIYGQSMGAIVAFELAGALERLGTTPRHLIVAASWPPDEIPSEDDIDVTDDEQVFAYLRCLGGTPASVMDEPGLRAHLLSAARPDLEAWTAYRHHRGPPLRAPVTAIAGLHDGIVDSSVMRNWRRYTTGPFAFVPIDADHFFAGAHEPLIAAVRTALSPPASLATAT